MSPATHIRRNVMLMAWGMVRGHIHRKYRLVQDWTPGPSYGRQRETTVAEKRAVFAQALREAWVTVKQMQQAEAERSAAARPVATLRAMVEAMENRERLGPEGLDRLSALRRELATAEARDRAEKREKIETQRGRIVAVTFIKTDGSERTMQVQPAALKSRVKGDVASEAAQKAVAARRANNPHLLNVWDVAKRGPRSINLDTVSRIAAGGEVHTFA